MSRKPEELLLALLGECILERDDKVVPVSVFLQVLERCGAARGTTRTTLQRMRSRGLFTTERSGREALYRPTESFLRVLTDAAGRVLATDPFSAEGSVWTMVTFSLPESERHLRHRLRADLSWAGFGDLRDGLWVASGNAELPESVRALASGSEALRVAAFRATEIDDLPMAKVFMSAWDIEAIRAEHLAFLQTWESADPRSDAPLRDVIWLIADWLSLLRVDPRLPLSEDQEWPAARSARTFANLHSSWRPEARREFETLMRAGAPSIN